MKKPPNDGILMGKGPAMPEHIRNALDVRSRLEAQLGSAARPKVGASEAKLLFRSIAGVVAYKGPEDVGMLAAHMQRVMDVVRCAHAVVDTADESSERKDALEALFQTLKTLDGGL